MAERSILFVLILILLEYFCYSQNEVKTRCNIAYRCSDEEKPIWATITGHDCLVYRNGCHFLSANCDRINRDEPGAVEISRELCQSFCGKICPPLFVPICAFHNDGHMRTFGNLCEMENHICRTGLTFSVFRAEKCPENTEYNK